MERMTPDTDKREGLGEGIYAKFVQNYEKLLEENKNLKERIEELEKCNLNLQEWLDRKKEENKNLKEKIKRLEFDVDAWHQLKSLLEGEIEKLRGLQICGKSVAERIEEDKKVVRE